MGQEEQTDIVFKIIVGLGIHNSLPDNSFNGQMLQFQSETASLTDLAEVIYSAYSKPAILSPSEVLGAAKKRLTLDICSNAK